MAAAGANHRLKPRSSTALSSSGRTSDSTATSHGDSRRWVMPSAHSATSTNTAANCTGGRSGRITCPPSSIEATLAWYSVPLIQYSREVGVSRRGAMPLAVMPTITSRSRSSPRGRRPSSTSM